MIRPDRSQVSSTEPVQITEDALSLPLPLRRERSGSSRWLLHPARGVLHVAATGLFWVYGAWDRLRRPAPRLPLVPAQVRRVLVIRLDLLGDLVFSLPAIEALNAAFPEATVDLLALPYAAPIAGGLPKLGTVHRLDVNRFRRPSGWRDLPRLVATLGALRQGRYDLAVGLSGLMGGVFAVASGARYRVGYEEETYPGCYNLPVPGRRYRRGPRHEVDYCLDLVRHLGLDAPFRRPVLDPGPPGRSAAPTAGERTKIGEATRPLNGSGSQPPPYAVLVPGASNGTAKRWPPPHWAALGDRLVRERGLTVVVTGSAAERGLAGAVVGAMTEEARNLAGSTSIDELRSLLAGATVVISGDTGPLHLASALGRPVVGIYGPTGPANTGPLAPAAAAVRLGLSCSPCYDLRGPAECKLPDRSVACMRDLRPERVFAAVSEVLDRPGKARGGA